MSNLDSLSNPSGKASKTEPIRLRIAFDVSDEYRRTLKMVSAMEGWSMTRTIMEALADKYPLMRDITDKEVAE